MQGFRCQGKPSSTSLQGHEQTFWAGPVYEPFTPAPLLLLETDRPPQQASPSSLPSLLNLVSLAFNPSDRQPQKSSVSPPWESTERCVQHSLRVMQMWADEGHIQLLHIHLQDQEPHGFVPAAL